MGESVNIDLGGGQAFNGYLSLPPSGKGPGLLIYQEIFGVNDAIRATADYFAKEGYVVLAPDMFWRLEPQASVLVHVGLLDPSLVPAAGNATAAKVLDETQPSNELMARWADSAL